MTHATIYKLILINNKCTNTDLVPKLRSDIAIYRHVPIFWQLHCVTVRVVDGNIVQCRPCPSTEAMHKTTRFNLHAGYTFSRVTSARDDCCLNFSYDGEQMLCTHDILISPSIFRSTRTSFTVYSVLAKLNK